MGLRAKARASWDVAVKFHYLLLSKSGLKSIKKQEARGVGGGIFSAENYCSTQCIAMCINASVQ